jgi:hypothetical protein
VIDPSVDADEEDNEPAYRGFATQGAPTHRAGQAFHYMGFDGERMVVNEDWAAKCEPCPALLQSSN